MIDIHIFSLFVGIALGLLTALAIAKVFPDDQQ